jgi:CrcB protein
VNAAALAGLLVGGAVGAPARYLLDGAVAERTDGRFPWGTFTVNVGGALLLGLITGAVRHAALSETARVWLGTGFCGAYTTFSTFAVETVRLLEEGARSLALRNAAMSLLAGTLAAAAGLALAALLWR